jgi:hypothetical protein
MTAHDELRTRLKAYHDAKALYDGPDPHDREESRYRAMCEARARVGDVALAEALLAAITEAEERGRREAFAEAAEYAERRRVMRTEKAAGRETGPHREWLACAMEAAVIRTHLTAMAKRAAEVTS